MRRYLQVASGLAAAMLAVALAPAWAMGETVPANARDGVQWGPCPPSPVGAPGPRPSNLECAKVPVRLDYNNPSGQIIDIAISRLKSPNPAKRRGVLALNPGGPGSPGLDMPWRIAQRMPQSMIDAYDLIGFDPRGTGEGFQITCQVTQEQFAKYFPYPDPPDPDGSLANNIAYAKQIAEQCGEHSGAALRYITTENTARDLDRIRDALGETKLSYLGYSYGSYLGAVYATLFPQRTDRIVLDSVVDPRGVWRGVWQHFAPGIDERFSDFAVWAAARNNTYGLGNNPEEVRKTYLALATRLDRDPFATPQGPIDGNELRKCARRSMYRDASFPGLAESLQVIKRGEPTDTPLACALSAPPDSAYLQSDIATSIAIFCEVRWPRSVDRYRHDVAVDARRYPVTNGMPNNMLPCAFWSVDPINPVQISDRGPSNILLVQNLRDPATPHFGALNMRAVLGSRARMVSVDAGGHSAYLYGANACANDAATNYLVNGVLPVADMTCPAEPGSPTVPQSELIEDLPWHELPL